MKMPKLFRIFLWNMGICLPRLHRITSQNNLSWIREHKIPNGGFLNSNYSIFSCCTLKIPSCTLKQTYSRALNPISDNEDRTVLESA